MEWRVVAAKARGEHSLDLTFKDGTRKRVNLRPLLDGLVFEPLLDPDYFALVKLDRVAGTSSRAADRGPAALPPGRLSVVVSVRTEEA